MRQNPIILDTDPGIDDAVAMIVLRRLCPERVKLVAASYGNVSLSHTVNNALTMRSLLNWDVPVLKGANRPASGEAPDASHIHGTDGLGGLSLSHPAGKVIEGDFLQILSNQIRAFSPVDYLTIGPLTNLALLLKRFPDIQPHIGRVVSMGGGINMGNVTPYAEFNIHCDPKSAAYVFKTMPDVSLVPLDTTTQVAFSLEQIERYTAGDTPLKKAMRLILTANYHACVGYGEPGSTMHDSTAVLYYLRPELFHVKKCGIDVVCEGEQRGRTLPAADRENITLTTGADTGTLLDIIGSCV